jgi:two-component system, NtrC family, sensor kinase
MTLNLLSQKLSTQVNLPSDWALFSGEEKERVLIVDDEETVRKLFADCLSDRYECFEASSVNEALAQLKKTEFALVLSDVIMPGLSGTELLRKIIENYPYTAVIMISGVDRPQRALDAIRLGAFDYLIKPCDLDVLELTVERALEKRALLNNARQYKLDLEARNNELVRSKVQLERLQSQIVQNEKMASLGQLSAGIAHELNNPVGFIYGNLDFLNQCLSGLVKLLNYYDDAELSETVVSGAAEIKAQIDYETSLDDLDSIISDCRDGAERIRNIVQNLRTFSRLDEAEFKKTDVHEGIDSTIRLLSRYFSGDNILLVREYSDLPLINAFSGQLNQVWMNLLVNAAQAVGQKGEVRITTSANDECVFIAISDNGDGIANEHLDRIFDPFYTTKPVGEGTGLGLTISFGIVKRHGGRISVDTKVNEGSTFMVMLPINAEGLILDHNDEQGG